MIVRVSVQVCRTRSFGQPALVQGVLGLWDSHGEATAGSFRVQESKVMPGIQLHSLNYKTSKCWATNYIKVLVSPQKVRTCLDGPAAPFPKFCHPLIALLPFHLHLLSQAKFKRVGRVKAKGDIKDTALRGCKSKINHQLPLHLPKLHKAIT